MKTYVFNTTTVERTGIIVWTMLLIFSDLNAIYISY